MLIVAVLPSILFPPKRPVRPAPGPPPEDTGTAARRPTPPPAARPSRPVLGGPTAGPMPAETAWVTTPLYRLGFSTLGAQLIAVELLRYKSLVAGDGGRPAQLVHPGRGLLGSEPIVGGAPVSL